MYIEPNNKEIPQFESRQSKRMFLQRTHTHIQKHMKRCSTSWATGEMHHSAWGVEEKDAHRSILHALFHQQDLQASWGCQTGHFLWRDRFRCWSSRQGSCIRLGHADWQSVFKYSFHSFSKSLCCLLRWVHKINLSQGAPNLPKFQAFLDGQNNGLHTPL